MFCSCTEELADFTFGSRPGTAGKWIFVPCSSVSSQSGFTRCGSALSPNTAVMIACLSASEVWVSPIAWLRPSESIR